jgi:hypothetical protein
VASLSSTVEDTNPNPTRGTPPTDWLAPLPTFEDFHRRRNTNVFQDPRYHHWGLSSNDGDAECTAAPRRIPDWVFPPEETQELFQAGYGIDSDLVYPRGVPDSLSSDSTSFVRK